MARAASRRGAAVFAVFSLLLASPAAAQDSLPPAPYAYKQLPDPDQEARAQALMETLRCLKCQSQSIADRTRRWRATCAIRCARASRRGRPEEIRQWLIERYGDYVSYTPQCDR
jgi:cytochrome c-type biogenesis protein CcmH